MKKIRLGPGSRPRVPVIPLVKLLLMMKMTAIIICMCSIQSFALMGRAQEKVSLNLKQISLKKAFKAIEKQTSIHFVYNDEMLQDAALVDVAVKEKAWTEALHLLLKNTTLSYKLVDDNLVVITTASKAETVARGKVTDAAGQPLIGVSLWEKGTSNGTVTKEDGSFNLSVKSDTSAIVFKYIGFAVREMKVSSGPMNVVLEEDNTSLNEVVVVGYGTQKAANLTGAVATVSAKTLESRPLTNIAQGLQGTLPGLNVNLNNGAPGQGASFNLRGVTEGLGNSASPLVLVDGVVMDPNLINPDDVENVTILKDAASAAIYGGRAAYGVILITTKSGKEGRLSVSYSGNYTISRPTRMPDYLSGSAYINMFRDAARRAGGNSYNYTDQDSILAAKFLADPANNSDVYVDPDRPNRYRYVGNTDWIDVLYPGYQPQQQHNISLSGGEGKTTYAASIGYFNQEGLLREADQRYKRYNASLRLTNKTTSWLDLNFKASLNHSALDGPNGTQFNNDDSQTWSFLPTDLTPLMPVRHPDGHFSGQGNYTNMVALMKLNGRQKYDINDVWLTGGFVIKPIKNVRIVTDYTWNGYFYNKTQHYKAFSEYGANGALLGTYPWTTPSRLFQTNSSDSYYALNSYAEYQNTFGSKHYLKAMIGYNEELKQNRSFGVTAKNLVDPTLPSLVPNNDKNPTLAAAQSEWAVSGSFFRLNYIYADKYLLEVNGRYDGTSRFRRGNRYLFAPSVSAGWRVSQEKFFAPLSNVVNDFKIRGSYGTLGNQLTDNTYPYIATMPIGNTTYVFNDNLTSPYVGAPDLVNPQFTWEKVNTVNIGIDATFLKNRLGIVFDRYVRTVKDLIVGSGAQPGILGANPPSANAADLQTKGWELNMTWRDELSKDFHYNVAFNLSDNISKITKYGLNPKGLINDEYVGFTFGDVWGYTTAGYFQSADEVSKSASQKEIWGGDWLPGDIRYVDLDGNGVINAGDNTTTNPGDKRIIGNTNPRYQFGLNIGADYKGFDATVFFQGTLKRDYWLGGAYFWGLVDEWSVPLKHNTDTWTPENRDAYYPVNKIGAWYDQETQTKYKQNAAYARLKQVTLGYSLPQSLLSRAKIARVRVYVTGQNVFEITKLHKAFDPELLGGQTYPLSRSWAFGLQIGL
ncbi:SusC/RagA family TonB-linked outer membrane protein [Chitinophaga sp. SYP-B3965]|uniref:TonB-dependent receptor n=1 Tax=Chitinophaga sp. SYP-B3965 TaxID=2663120 RepID=UPI0012995CAA|nr:TonB-dependent receptor [Chitinophaga sp. SYP-B3965]MRG43534.1 SusC/RagA family TonB-linked outer membrane protein [Chitinophaga sp. SYP-B3965]